MRELVKCKRANTSRNRVELSFGRPVFRVMRSLLSMCCVYQITDAGRSYVSGKSDPSSRGLSRCSEREILICLAGSQPARRFLSVPRSRQQQPIIDDPDFKGRVPAAAAAAAAAAARRCFFKATARIPRIRPARSDPTDGDLPRATICFPFFLSGSPFLASERRERIEPEHA